MFYDYAKIYIKGGDGGNGVVAFRREKYVPLGGPSGGDGGDGGDVIFVGDPGLKTLVDFKYKQHYKAERGEHGQGKTMHGKNAPDLVISVPLGTLVKEDGGEIVADITEDGQRVVVAKGGRGGRGNARFATSKQKAPRIAEKGEPGQEHWLIMELKLLADVGIIGMPNAGKSTFISKVSASRPKIADYPFTTLVPNLGVVDMGEGNSFVVADLPGLIEGAAEGVGLGHRFLRHVERTKVLIHMLDMSEQENRQPWDDYAVIQDELYRYKKSFKDRPQVVVANKMDSTGAQERLAELKQKLPDKEIFPISALTGEGIQPLLWRVFELLQQTPAMPIEVAEEEVRHVLVREEAPWQIQQLEEGLWRVTGEEVEKLVMMTDMESEDAVARMQRIFKNIGLEEAMRKAGIEEGDSVFIGTEEFEYSE